MNAPNTFTLGVHYSTGAAVVAGMAAALVAETDRAALHGIAAALDSYPVESLKGTAYLLHLLSRDDGDAPDQHRQALVALADHVELMAAFLDLQAESCDALALAVFGGDQ